MSFRNLLYFVFPFRSTPFTLSFLLTLLFITIALGLFSLYRYPLLSFIDDLHSAHTKCVNPNNCLICHIMCCNYDVNTITLCSGSKYTKPYKEHCYTKHRQKYLILRIYFLLHSGHRTLYQHAVKEKVNEELQMEFKMAFQFTETNS
jgi:hypothetical protein